MNGPPGSGFPRRIPAARKVRFAPSNRPPFLHRHIVPAAALFQTRQTPSPGISLRASHRRLGKKKAGRLCTGIAGGRTSDGFWHSSSNQFKRRITLHQPPKGLHRRPRSHRKIGLNFPLELIQISLQYLRLFLVREDSEPKCLPQLSFLSVISPALLRYVPTVSGRAEPPGNAFIPLQQIDRRE